MSRNKLRFVDWDNVVDVRRWLKTSRGGGAARIERYADLETDAARLMFEAHQRALDVVWNKKRWRIVSCRVDNDRRGTFAAVTLQEIDHG